MYVTNAYLTKKCMKSSSVKVSIQAVQNLFVGHLPNLCQSSVSKFKVVAEDILLKKVKNVSIKQS